MKLLKRRILSKRQSRMEKARLRAGACIRRRRAVFDASQEGQERRLARRFFLTMRQMYTYRGYMSDAWLKSMAKNGRE